MNVGEAAEKMGITPRRVRALIAQGQISAMKVGASWEVHDLGWGARQRRPLSARSRSLLADVLHQRSLGGLRGQDRARTAARIRLLRSVDDPARLLNDWWAGRPDVVVNGGTNLVLHAIRGNDAYVRRMVRTRPREYLRRASDLADIVASERAIAGWTRAQLAEAAGVPLDVVARIERAQPVGSPADLRRVLRAIDVEPTALPTMAAS